MTTPTTAVKPPLTISEYASLNGYSRSAVQKYIAQGRLPVTRRGGGAARAGIVLVMTTAPVEKVQPGTLTPAQRAAWKKK